MLGPYCLSFYLLLYYLDLNVRDIENLSSQQRELQEAIASLEESVKRFQDEEKSFRKQAANLRKQKVGYRTFYILISIYCYISVQRFFRKGTCVVDGSF